MRSTFFAGAVAAIVVAVLSVAIRLLNRPDDFAVAAGYFVLLALVSLASGAAIRLGRRL